MIQAKAKALTLKEFVANNGGPERVAKTLNVSGRAVRIWVDGTSTPRIKTMMTLVKKSGGRISMEQILRETSRHRPDRSNRAVAKKLALRKKVKTSSTKRART